MLKNIETTEYRYPQVQRDAEGMTMIDEVGIDQIRELVNSVFSLAHLESAHPLINLGRFQFPDGPFPRTVDHYMIKSNDCRRYDYGELGGTAFPTFIDFIEEWARNARIDLASRYCFLTVDQGWVEPGSTLRDRGRNPMWHIDGMQGDEVPNKKLADLQFIWSDCLATQIADQGFNVAELDPSVHHVFKWLERQIDPSKIFRTASEHVYAMSPYHVHRPVEATERAFRRFVRASYTYTPVTSTYMTLNPAANYNYPYHTTTGRIPDHLI